MPIKYSRKKGNKYVNFIQDDYQYVYNKPNLLQCVNDAFNSRKNVVQLHTNRVWRYKIRKIGKFTPVFIKGVKWFYLHDKYPCDNGFTRVSLFKKIGLYPSNVSIHGKERKYIKGEKWLAKKCKNKHRMMLAEPNMAMMPDCAFVRGNVRHGRYLTPPAKFYLKPFDENQINSVKKRSKNNKMCFIEDIVITDGWTPLHSGKHSTLKIKKRI